MGWRSTSAVEIVIQPPQRAARPPLFWQKIISRYSTITVIYKIYSILSKYFSFMVAHSQEFLTFLPRRIEVSGAFEAIREKKESSDIFAQGARI